MGNPEDNFGGPVEIGMRQRWAEIAEMEALSAEANSVGNRRCFEGLAWFAGAAASAFLTAYNVIETNQLEHLPPDKVTAAGGLISVALVGRSAIRFKQGVELTNIGVRLHQKAKAKKDFTQDLEKRLGLNSES